MKANLDSSSIPGAYRKAIGYPAPSQNAGNYLAESSPQGILTLKVRCIPPAKKEASMLIWARGRICLPTDDDPTLKVNQAQRVLFLS